MRVLAVVVAAGALLGAGSLCDLPTASASQAVVEAADTTTVRLRIEGMTCGGCAISARALLRRMEGVETAEVNYDEGIAVVTYDPAEVEPQDMIDALHETFHYTTTVVADAPAERAGA